MTGGGTREPLDDVRYVGNRASGRLALEVMRQGVARGHPMTGFLAESAAVEQLPEGVSVVRFDRAGELQARLLERGEEREPDALIHSAAVSDYVPERETGKVPSGRNGWTVTLRPAPKVVDAFRARCPRPVLILFKLESGVSREELFRRALRAGDRVQASRVFANLLEETGDRHRGWLLRCSDQSVEEAAGRPQIAELLLDAVEEDCERGEA